ncbi:MAG TPA: hypothetical protein VJK26_01805 [Patescibacteria group bacterium]|nr:hypothetical protein [Patescibacteria group bacterium]
MKKLMAVVVLLAIVGLIYACVAKTEKTIPEPSGFRLSRTPQASIDLVQDRDSQNIAISWVKDGQGRIATVNEPIGEEVTIGTPQNEDSERGVSVNINLPKREIQKYWLCLEGKKGQKCRLETSFLDARGRIWPKKPMGFSFRLHREGKVFRAYLLLTCNPKKTPSQAMTLWEVAKKDVFPGHGGKR